MGEKLTEAWEAFDGTLFKKEEDMLEYEANKTIDDAIRDYMMTTYPEGVYFDIDKDLTDEISWVIKNWETRK